MAERKVYKAVSTKKAELKQKQEAEQIVDLEAQDRLVEVLTDSPRIVSLNGTPWEVKALRMGTQYLIARKVIEIDKSEKGTFGDIMKHFAVNIPAVVEVLTLALLNSKEKIYKNGVEGSEFSELYWTTYETLMWRCNVQEFGPILLEVLQMLDTSFFLESCRILEMFKASTTARKTPMAEQK